MDNLSDQHYLLSEQYKTPANLDARVYLHQRFSTNPYPWQRWVFDHLVLPDQAHILEIGCGPGHLWQQNLDRIAPGWQVMLADLSSGMLAEARGKLAQAEPACDIQFCVADAQVLPFRDGEFEAVVANHMLYHVPDRQRAIADIRRVLKPGGKLYAATNGEGQMCELGDLVRHVVPNKTFVTERVVAAFGLENGGAQLAPRFGTVTVHRYDGWLDVTEAEPLIAYVLSGRSLPVGERPGALSEFSQRVRRQLALDGAIRITTSSGLFEAQKR